MKHKITEELNGVLTFIGTIWVVFIVNLVVPAEFNRLGLIPREISGAFGILTMPFLHSGWQHLLGNTVPLAILLCLLAGSRASTYRIVPQIIVLGGALSVSYTHLTLPTICSV